MEKANSMRYLIYTIATIKDVIAYNEHNTLNGEVLDRIEKELGILEGIKETKYTKKQFERFHIDLLELKVSTLPTTEKAIRKFGE